MWICYHHSQLPMVHTPQNSHFILQDDMLMANCHALTHNDFHIRKKSPG